MTVYMDPGLSIHCLGSQSCGFTSHHSYGHIRTHPQCDPHQELDSNPRQQIPWINCPI